MVSFLVHRWLREALLLFLGGSKNETVHNYGCTKTPYYIIIIQVLLKDGQLPSEGEEIARDLMEKLNISSDNLIECAYVDLLLGSWQ